MNLNKLIELDPRDLYYEGRSDAYMEKGEYDLAIVDLNKVIELNPKLARAYVSRGQIYLEKSDYDQAIIDLSKGMELDPKYSAGWVYGCRRGGSSRKR